MQSIVALPHKPHWVAVIGNDKAGILDIKTKRHVRYYLQLSFKIGNNRIKIMNYKSENKITFNILHPKE